MARRFGGRYSPGATGGATGGAPEGPAPGEAFRGRRASAVDVRSLLMFVWPTPLIFAGMGALAGGAAVRMLLLLAAYGALIGGAWLLRQGQWAEAEYDARSVARPPAFPRKIGAAILTGAGVALASWLGAEAGAAAAAAAEAAVFGAIAAGAHLLAFGLDPLRAKGGSLAGGELDRVAEALEKAEAKLRSIEALAHRMRDREIDGRIKRLNATVRDMIRLVERDPRDLGRARRYLGVYLTGAEEATRKYAENRERLDDPKLHREYLALLSDLEGSFARGREMLLVDDRTDLEVEIEVLRERLGQEGA
jgi:5-bromo-4-chloroindolyl phosphate hydrolysis protein